MKADDLAKAINATLEEYKDVAIDAMKEAVDNASKTAVKELKADSPKRTGAYAKSWAEKSEKQGKELAYKKIVFNKKHYRLTHLLEKGHVKVNGGFVSARPHIRDVEQKVIEQFEKELREKL